jgi:hypothetical protein
MDPCSSAFIGNAYVKIDDAKKFEQEPTIVGGVINCVNFLETGWYFTENVGKIGIA